MENASDSSSSSSPGLAPDVESHGEALTAFINAIALVTASAHSVINTTFTDPETPAPSWFTTLQTDLGTAQSHAQSWIEDLGPTITTTVPQQIIEYGSTFSNVVMDVTTILHQAGSGPLSSADFSQSNSLLQALVSQLKSSDGAMQAAHSQLVAFLGLAEPPPGTGITGDAYNLGEGSSAAQEAINVEESMIAAINSQITLLTTEMQQANTNATYSEIAIAGGIFLTICAVALTVATGGLGGVVLATCIYGVGGAIALAAIYTDEVKAYQKQINSLQSELTADQQLVCSLMAIEMTATGLQTSLQTAQVAMSTILSTWATLLAKTEDVLANLEKVENASDPSVIKTVLEVQDAQSAWSQLTSFANKIEAAGTNITVTIAPPLSSSAGSAA